MARTAMYEDNGTLNQFGQTITKKAYDTKVANDWSITNDSLRNIEIDVQPGTGKQIVLSSGENVTISNNHQALRQQQFVDNDSLALVPIKGHFEKKLTLTRQECQQMVENDPTMVPLLTSRFGSLLHAYRANTSCLAESWGAGDIVQVPAGQGTTLNTVPFDPVAKNFAAINSMIVFGMRAQRNLKVASQYLGTNFTFTSTDNPLSPKLAVTCVVRKVDFDYRHNALRICFDSDAAVTVLDGAWICFDAVNEGRNSASQAFYPFGRKRVFVPKWYSQAAQVLAEDYYGDTQWGGRGKNPDAYVSRQIEGLDGEANRVTLLHAMGIIDTFGNGQNYILEVTPARFRKMMIEDTLAGYNVVFPASPLAESRNIQAGRDGISLMTIRNRVKELIENPDLDDDEFILSPAKTLKLASYNTAFQYLIDAGNNATREATNQDSKEVSGDSYSLSTLNGPNIVYQPGQSYLEVKDAEGNAYGGAKDFFFHFDGSFYNDDPSKVVYGHFGDHLDGSAFSTTLAADPAWFPAL